MGFFSKLFGKNDSKRPVAQTAATSQQTAALQAAAPATQTLGLKADKVIRLLGGKDNIVDLRTCAYTRVRVQLKSPVSGVGVGLQEAGLAASMPVNDQVMHLLAGLQAEAVCKALKEELAD